MMEVVCIVIFHSHLFLQQPIHQTIVTVGLFVSATSSYTSITYSWSNGVSGQYNVGLCVGMYTVTVTDIYGCTVDSTIAIGNVILGCTDSTAVNYNASCKCR